jgi:hypothetical protein
VGPKLFFLKIPPLPWWDSISRPFSSRWQVETIPLDHAARGMYVGTRWNKYNPICYSFKISDSTKNRPQILEAALTTFFGMQKVSRRCYVNSSTDSSSTDNLSTDILLTDILLTDILLTDILLTDISLTDIVSNDVSLNDISSNDISLTDILSNDIS